MARRCKRQGGKPQADHAVRQGEANTATPYVGKGRRTIQSIPLGDDRESRLCEQGHARISLCGDAGRRYNARFQMTAIKTP